MNALSVIICTHNPRADYLTRTLDALKAQTLPKEKWELLLIDNASKEPLSQTRDLSWHPNARHIREDELGLTPARMRGIREAAAEVLVFVDDDNLLRTDYLENALKLTVSHPWVAAFGGNMIGEFESEPESCIRGVLHELTLGEVKEEVWARYAKVKDIYFGPAGAGMVIRKMVATYYAEMSASDPLRHGLDRKGASLISAGDVDMALCSCVLGFAVGRFPQLYLTHLIPSTRLQRDYLLRLIEAKMLSSVILQFIWDGTLPMVSSPSQPQEHPSRSEKIFRAYQALRQRFKAKPSAPKPEDDTKLFEEEVKRASLRGVLRGAEILNNHRNGTAK